MKNKILLLALCSAFLVAVPGDADATSYCELVSGDGIKFGSEVACGDEHFYIFGKNDDGIRMLAKYNLGAGETTYRVPIENIESMAYLEREQHCNDVMSSNGGFRGKTMTFASDFYKSGDNYNYCFYSKNTQDGKMRQMEEARSAHWDDNGNYLYPQVGDVYISSHAGIMLSTSDSAAGKQFDFGYFPTSYGVAEYLVDLDSSAKYPKVKYLNLYDFELNFNNTKEGVAPVVSEYNQELIDAGYNVVSATIPTIDDFNEAAASVGRSFDYENEWDPNGSDPGHEVVTGDNVRHARNLTITDYFSGEYSWVWDRSYWLRTMAGTLGSGGSGPTVAFFIDEFGDICSTDLMPAGWAGSCSSAYSSAFGLGVRPLITVDAIKFRIRTESGEGGEIEAPITALGDERIAFRAAAKPGYRLAGLTVATEAGEEITLSDEELEHDADGNIVIRSDRFTMPFNNVVIRANWDGEAAADESDMINPETFDGIVGDIALASGVLLFSVFVSAVRRR